MDNFVESFRPGGQSLRVQFRESLLKQTEDVGAQGVEEVSGDLVGRFGQA